MELFVAQNSIVRRIWGKADTVMFIFAGSAAEFALNKAVDWLYFTGRLPADPLGRLFSTVAYAHRIIFSPYKAAINAIDSITAIHRGVENNRGSQIPDWAYRDVLFMLIDYSIRSFELLERKLTEAEKAETFDVFYRVGLQMGLTGLPADYPAWKVMRQQHLEQDLICSHFTLNLYEQYKKHLGFIRYQLVKQVQVLLLPQHAWQLLRLNKTPWLTPVLAAYKFARILKVDGFLKSALLPPVYKLQVQQLDVKQ